MSACERHTEIHRFIHCREELPCVNRLYIEFTGKGLEILLVNFRETPDPGLLDGR